MPGTSVDPRWNRPPLGNGDARKALDRGLLEAFAQTRDPRARERLVEHFMPLARALAFRYQGIDEPIEDLVQVAVLGLIKAIDRFDPDRQDNFVAYAAPTIDGTIRHHLRDHTSRVHVPRGIKDRAQRVRTTSDELTTELGRNPTPAEVATRCGCSVRQALEALSSRQAHRPLSLDSPTWAAEEAGDAVPMIEALGSEETGFEEVHLKLAAAKAPLKPSERRVLDLIYLRGLTQAQAGKRIGVSQMQISRIHSRALRKLLEMVQADQPPPAGPAQLA